MMRFCLNVRWLFAKKAKLILLCENKKSDGFAIYVNQMLHKMRFAVFFDKHDIRFA